MSRIQALFFSLALGASPALVQAETPGIHGDQPYKSFTNADGLSVDFPACFDSEGVQVRLRVPTQRDRQMAQDDGRSAVSGIGMSGPTITMPYFTIQNNAPDTLKFIWEHECSHHSLGQVRAIMKAANENPYGAGINMSSAELHKIELAADCKAVESLVGRGEMSVDEILDVLSRFPSNAHSTTHPHTDERIEQVAACAVVNF